MDLNLQWPQSDYSAVSSDQLTLLRNTIATSYVLGYSTLAVNFEIDESVKIPVNKPDEINPIKLDSLIDVSKYPGLKIFTRLTLVVSDSSKLINFSKFSSYFDIIAVKPMTEKVLQNSIMNLTIDMISVPLSTKLTYYLKHKIIGSGVKKGIKFEMCYSSLISSSANNISRKLFISNLMQLIRATRSNGIIIASGAKSPATLRTFNNIVTFLSTLGLKVNQINQFADNAEKVLISGRLRIKSYKQTVAIGDDPTLYDNSQEDKKNNNNANSYKRSAEELQKATKRRK